jgi:hypothetical protein
MNGDSQLTPENLQGVFELDLSGTVVYCRNPVSGTPADSKENLIGLNFFEEIASFNNGKEFQRRFSRFISEAQPTDHFDFSFRLEEKESKVKVMLVRVCERSYDNNSDLVIVDIRKHQQ